MHSRQVPSEQPQAPPPHPGGGQTDRPITSGSRYPAQRMSWEKFWICSEVEDKGTAEGRARADVDPTIGPIDAQLSIGRTGADPTPPIIQARGATAETNSNPDDRIFGRVVRGGKMAELVFEINIKWLTFDFFVQNIVQMKFVFVMVNS